MKNNNTEMTNQQTLLLSDLFIRVACLEKILLDKQIILKEELEMETKKIVSELSEKIKEIMIEQNNATSTGNILSS